MANLLDLLNSDLGKTLINGTSQQIGADKGKTASAISAALPLILGAMKNNAKTPEGASGLLNALNNDKHSGGVLDNLGSILGGGGIDDDVLNDGAGILGHVFRGKEQNVAGAVSKSSGLDMGSAMQILKVAAPFIMGALGKQKRQQGVSDTNGLGNLLGGMLGDDDPQEQSMIEKLLDADGDGSVIDDVAGMILGGGNKKSGGIGSILGGLFK
ncbi:DUF937 domain-containing protein [Aureibaculum sp. 2210JD6-5]|uniref:DUF937 domain-containing protein n=1 Tax=Aureibaculum sp. 2210JD6-5 TaxID=3103957 RepID=UPI002AAD38C8|nr:DUF937 domain-containing protein [Aureibaculum sp. 2210JD6-5]MDY7393816.1 DUF937 domain-containing protein [Aureibaculum sp. 2210JD6-5]